MNQKQNKILFRIQKLELQIIDLNIYLDIYPEDRQALCEYNRITQELMVAKKDYEAVYGPLTNFGFALSKYPWQWLQPPWPWEI